MALRRLRDALLSGDPIISVILSSAVNNDGNRKVGYTAPSVAGQQAVIEEALMLAAIDDRQVGYIETHGTAHRWATRLKLKRYATSMRLARRISAVRSVP